MIQISKNLEKQLEKFQKKSETADTKREIVSEVQQTIAKEGNQV